MKLKKSLGQNFLQDQTILNKIVSSARLEKNDLVIEIGPGAGALTEKLVAQVKKILAIEIDERLVELLTKNFFNNPKVKIIQQDILQGNLNKLLLNFTNSSIQTIQYKVVANIPYYITSPIIRLLLEAENPPQEIILMVQKEVAQRICSQAGQMSLLSVAVQYYAEVELLFEVAKESFQPIPKVDSAVIRIIPKEKELSSVERKEFFKIVRAGFCAKRKTLINNLSNSLHLDKNKIAEKFKKINLNFQVRAQELSVEDWEKLRKLFN